MTDGHGAPSNLLVCANGHRMIAGTSMCPTCGASPSTLGRVEATPISQSSRTIVIVAAIAIALLVVGAIAGAVALIAGGRDGGTVTETTGAPTAGAAACDDPSVPILSVGGEVTTTSPVVCLTVDTSSDLAVGAYPVVEGQDLAMSVYTVSGVYWAAADDGVTIDPEVVGAFEPDTYVITVTAFGDAPLGEYTIYAIEFTDDGDLSLGEDVEFPTVDQCGSAEVPSVVDDALLPLTAETPFVCVTVSSAAFMKLGAQSFGTSDGLPADLRLALYEFNGTDTPTFIRTVDDYFGLDPEISIDLSAGQYLVYFDTWNGSPTGEFTAYVDSKRSYFRLGDVSAEFAYLDVEACDTLPQVELGVEYVVNPGDEPVVCLTVPSQQRLVIETDSMGSGQDLTVEVISFETSSGQRFAWNDDDVFSTEPGQIEPRLDISMPAGTYAIAWSDFYGEAEVQGVAVTVRTK